MEQPKCMVGRSVYPPLVGSFGLQDIGNFATSLQARKDPGTEVASPGFHTQQIRCYSPPCEFSIIP